MRSLTTLAVRPMQTLLKEQNINPSIELDLKSPSAMQENSPLNISSGSLSAKRAGEWSADVHLFFSEEWSRLRLLIMSMEEDSWKDADPSSGYRTPTPSEHFPSDSESAGFSHADRIDEPPVDQADANAVDRLSVLERRIEQQLRVAVAGRR